jgi:hypothetical protein
MLTEKGRQRPLYAVDITVRRVSFHASAEEVCLKMKRIGVTHYVWVSGGDSSVCRVCSQRNRKFFAYADRHKDGQPGDCPSCTGDACRCIARPVLSESSDERRLKQHLKTRP